MTTTMAMNANRYCHCPNNSTQWLTDWVALISGTELEVCNQWRINDYVLRAGECVDKFYAKYAEPRANSCRNRISDAVHVSVRLASRRYIPVAKRSTMKNCPSTRKYFAFRFERCKLRLKTCACVTVCVVSCRVVWVRSRERNVRSSHTNENEIKNAPTTTVEPRRPYVRWTSRRCTFIFHHLCPVNCFPFRLVVAASRPYILIDEKISRRYRLPFCFVFFLPPPSSPSSSAVSFVSI